MTATAPSAHNDTINLMDPIWSSDPRALVDRVTAAGGSAPALFADGFEVTLFTDDEDVRTILSDRRFVVNPDNVRQGAGTRTKAEIFEAMGVTPDLAAYMTENILAMDGSDHTRLRKLVSRSFTVRRVNELRPRVQRITDDLLSRLPDHAENGAVDLLEHFAYPLPITVICDLVGVPEEDRPLWREWSSTLQGFDPTRPELMNSVLGEMIDHLKGMIEQRRRAPHDDLLDALIRERDEDGAKLSEAELIAMVFTLVIAGHETTAHLLTNGTHALLTHRDQWDMLRADPDLLPSAVHEMLRWCGIALITQVRYAAEDVRLGSGRLAAGDRAVAVIMGANRDPNVHPDPHRFDITRHHGKPGEAHVGFGHGIHYCLGAALARQEGQVAFGSLLRTYPDLALVPGREPERVPTPGALRFKDLYVRLTG
ncbi:cytochrome P450 family protein [Nocardiopsis lucentensis]|uniref:cytochrome P450 family protein n=1 Tax=Nocardiopsis lucentensis TaxID=53441 RepID=UPI00034758B7|nr:cytochrome P450 [Nocardiopsis lucentensis]